MKTRFAIPISPMMTEIWNQILDTRISEFGDAVDVRFSAIGDGEKRKLFLKIITLGNLVFG